METEIKTVKQYRETGRTRNKENDKFINEKRIYKIRTIYAKYE